MTAKAGAYTGRPIKAPARENLCFAGTYVLVLVLHWLLEQCVLIFEGDSTKESATSTIGASSSDDPHAQTNAPSRRGQQSSAAQGDAASQLFAPTSSRSTNTPSRMARSVLPVVLPSNLGAPQLDASEKAPGPIWRFPTAC